MTATSERIQDPPAFAGHSPSDERPLGAYGALTGAFLALAGAFAAWLRRSGRPVPERIDSRDLVLMTVATQKLSRLVAKDRVTSLVRAPFTELDGDEATGEVTESARGTGLRRAIGELILCPYCLGLWFAGLFAAGMLVAPRLTRWTASVFTVLFGSDVLQIAYRKLEDSR